MGVKMDPYLLGDSALDSLFSDGEVVRKINFFNIPGLVRYQFKKHVFIELGPVIGLRYKAIDIFTNSIETKGDLQYKNDISANLTRFEY